MADSEVKVIISGQIAGLITSMQEASASVTGAVNQMTSALKSVSGIFSAVSQAFVAFGAAMTAGRIFNDIIDSTKEFTGEAITLGRTLGITATQAAIYNLAIESVGGSSGDFMSASRGLTRQLKTQEEGMNNLGVVTRDGNGKLLESSVIMQHGINVVNSYKEGQDRALAATAIFGRGVNANNPIFRTSAETMAQAAIDAEELNLTVGVEGVAAYKESQKATSDFKDVMLGLKKAIGDELIPVISTFMNWIREIGPTLVLLVKGALGGFVAALWGIVTTIRILNDTTTAAFKSIIDTISNAADAIAKALSGDWSGATASIKKIPKDIQKNFSEGWDKIVKDAEDAQKKILNVFSKDTPQGKAKDGKDFTAPDTGKGQDTRLAAYKNELDEQRQAAGDYQHKDLAADEAFWTAKLALVVGNSAKNQKLRVDINKELLTIARKQQDEEMKMAEESVKSTQTLALGNLAAKKVALQADFDQQKITQAQLTVGLLLNENQKFIIEKKALDERLALVKFDKLARQKLNDQELALTQAHEAAQTAIEDTAEKKAHDDAIKLKEDEISTTQTLGLGEIANKQAQLDQDLSMLRITQQQEYAGELELENARFALQRKYYADKLVLARHDAVQMAALRNQLLVAEQGHALAEKKITDKSVLDQNKDWIGLFSTMKSGFATTIAGFLNGTATLGQTVKGLFQNVASAVVDALSKMLAQQIINVITGNALSKSSSLAQKQDAAAVAAGNAWKSAAGIPIVGWILAPIAAAAAYAGVLAFGTSAAGGYDVPAGVNPVTQLHAKEMVLPAHLADAVRGMAAGGGKGGGAGTSLNFTVQAVDGQSVKKVLLQHKGTIAQALKRHMKASGSRVATYS